MHTKILSSKLFVDLGRFSFVSESLLKSKKIFCIQAEFFFFLEIFFSSHAILKKCSEKINNTSLCLHDLVYQTGCFYTLKLKQHNENS